MRRLSSPFRLSHGSRLGLGDADSKIFRTQTSLLSSIPTIICSFKNISATFLHHLILFHLSRLHSWQYTARMAQRRPLRPPQGYVHSPGIPLHPVIPLQIGRQVVGRVGSRYLFRLSHCSGFFTPEDVLTLRIRQFELPGEIGSGPRDSESAYWIDAYSAYLGCTNAGPDDCSIMVKGFQNVSLFSVISQGFTLPPCPGMKNCSLALVEFADGFRNLNGLQITATVGTTPVDWYMDNLSLGWSNNTCAAQLERSSQE